MSNQNNNPFSLPGFGQTGDLSQNPLMASMEMMRQAWQGMATSGVLTQPAVAAGLTTEDLDRRISDLRAVENWLRINMSMLSSSIQALEVQRATIATLKSFANVPGASGDAGDNPSPLEVVLGIKPSGQAKIKTPAQAHEGPPESAGEPQAAPGAAAPDQAFPFQSDPAALSGAAQGWWDMLQKQFDTLAEATAAGMHTAQQAAQPSGKPAGHTAPRKAASKPAAKAATGSGARKSAAGKSAGTNPASAKRAAKSTRKRAVRTGRPA